MTEDDKLFNEQLKLDVLVCGMTEITCDYVNYQKRGSKLTEVIIPEGITKIGDWAFGGCWRLKNITIPNSVKEIGINAFFCCKSLTTVTIPEGVTCIEYGTFDRCEALSNITIPNTVTEIGYNAFFACDSLTNVTIPNSVTEIDEGAFDKHTKLERLA